MMMLNLTAFSQITGIPKETKQEIVYTLMAYPIALEEINTLSELNREFVELLKKEQEKNSIYEELFINQQNEIDNLLKQKKEYKKQLEKTNSYGFIYGQVNLNGLDYYAIGIDYIVKGKIIVGGNISYDNFYKNVNTNLKIGFKTF